MLNMLKELEQKEVGFYVTHPCPYGQKTVVLDAQEIADYSVDPVGFLAKYYKVPREVYIDWHRSDYNVICAGKTKKGHRCRNTVPGLSGVDTPKKWMEGQGLHCNLHI